jgi:urea-proton symporter
MKFLSPTTGYLLLLGFAVFMVLITLFWAPAKPRRTREFFLAADRGLRWWVMGPSIAATWIWAGALFVSTQMSYEKGLAGIFWFTFPNVIALAVYAFLGPKIRKRFRNGFTLPQFVRDRLGSNAVHKIFLVPFFLGQLSAVLFNVAAGGVMVSTLTGIPIAVVMPIIALIALSYTLISGLQASVITDVIQIGLILLAAVVIVPMTVGSAGGLAAIAGGLGGKSGEFANIFDPSVAFSFGIVTSIGLISQTISDQMFWQRVFAVHEKDIAKAFLFGAFLFALVPLSFSMLGFMAANPGLSVNLPAGSDASLIGVLTVNAFQPVSMLVLFVVAMLAGLCSTVDSALSATSSLWSTDVVRHSPEQWRILDKRGRGEDLAAEETAVLGGMDANIVRQSRLSMVVLTVAGLALAFAVQFIAGFGIKQIFVVGLAIPAAISMPIVLTLYWERLSARGVFWGVLVAVVVGIPLAVYATSVNDPVLIVAAPVAMLAISTGTCVVLPRERTAGTTPAPAADSAARSES